MGRGRCSLALGAVTGLGSACTARRKVQGSGALIMCRPVSYPHHGVTDRKQAQTIAVSAMPITLGATPSR